LQAYYQHEDPRALENWQRLDPQRLPARLAAPLRWQIDPAFRASQPPATQAALQKQLDRLQSHSVTAQLRQLRKALGDKESLAAALRQAEALLPALRQHFPHLVPRLSSIFYWKVQDTGPEDAERYRRVFGAPADDPQLHRMSALACEKVGLLEEGHRFWQKYERELAQMKGVWPEQHLQRARALVWLEMGENAASLPTEKEIAKLPAFLRNHPDRPRPLNPSAEKCFERSLELALDLLEAHEALFRQYRKAGQSKKAQAVARRLLERFPDHIPTLQGLAELLEQEGEPEEALALLLRALKNNPLQRDLREGVGHAYLLCGRASTQAGQFDKARQHYQAAVALEDRANKSPIYCKWAACEFRAGQTARAEELLQQASSQSPSALDVHFTMVIELGRLKLPRPLKAPFDRDFKAGLAAPPTAADVVALLQTATHHELAGVTYHGQKTHVKQILTYVDKARTKVNFAEKDLDRVCEALLDLGAKEKLVQGYITLGRKRYPHSPVFPYLTALQQVRKGPDVLNGYRVSYDLEEAERLAHALPAGPDQQEILEKIGDLQDIVRTAHRFGMSSMFRYFDRFGPGEFMDIDDFDDFDDEDEAW
jgi:tetratricopeptide (TPR) repeat protein